MPDDSHKKPPRFFLSYARDKDSYLERFYADLRREIAFKEGLEDDEENVEPGFRDVDHLPGATDWQEGLAEVLRDSFACVCIYTPLYFRSEYCGKELQVFLDRNAVSYDSDGAAVNTRGILPVLWASMEDLRRHEQPPSIVRRINFRAGKHHARYEKEGLRHILKRGPRTAAYRDILDAIVEDIVRSFKPPLPASPARPTMASVRNAFANARAVALGAGPGSLAVFPIVAPGSKAALSSQDWGALLGSGEPALSVELVPIDAARIPPAELLRQVAERSERNVLVFVYVEPDAVRVAAPLVGELLTQVTRSANCTCIILTTADAGLTPIQVPAENAGRIKVFEVPRTADQLAKEVPRLALEALKLVVEQSNVMRHLPGGGVATEKPKIRGPGSGTDGSSADDRGALRGV